MGVDDSSVGGEGDRTGAPRRNPGRCGEQGQQEVVERLQRLQRLLRLGREQRPWRQGRGRCFVSSDLLIGFFQILL